MIELMLALAAMVTLTAVIFIAFPKVMSSRHAAYETQVLITAVASTKDIFNSGKYDNLTDAGAAQGRVFPDNMIVDDTMIVNQFDSGDVHVGGVSDRTINNVMGAAVAGSRLLGISYGKVPSAVCIKLAGSVSPYFPKIVVGEVEVKNTLPGGAPMALDEELVTTACNTPAGAVTMTFITN